MFYILKEGGQVDSEGHCKETDVLIRAVAKWTSQLYQEVFIFDDGCWIKSKTMWKAVQRSSWDNVILDLDMKEQLMKDVHGFFDSEQSYAELTIPWKRGIIFYGSPGNGKTATIKTLAKGLSGRTNPI
ncbi:hypothetical protein BCR34DRAFT_592018 [Clohesyomyces aquaticus]|uniref:ATPase AAA-type core domain-containing protein n=1 Tax=Clohesyomyces aquaticus TaxID=1231657 RepID=A0A1Y1YVV6_9PLEO|nr:hypothetical protein BCR34DRAFT_592018 [Clohesyomyces aquaticus]